MKEVTLPNGSIIKNVPDNMDDADVYQIALDKGIFRPVHKAPKPPDSFSKEGILDTFGRAREDGRAVAKGLSYGASVPLLGDPEDTTRNDLLTLGTAAISPLGLAGRRPGGFLAKQASKVIPKIAGPIGQKYLGGALGEGLVGTAAGFGLSSGDDRLSDALMAGGMSLAANPLISAAATPLQYGYHLLKPSAKFVLDKIKKLGKTSTDELTSAGAKTLAEISPVARAGIAGIVTGSPHVAQPMRQRLVEMSTNVSKKFDDTLKSNVGKTANQEQKYLKKLSDVKATSKEHYQFLEGKQSSFSENQIDKTLEGIKGLKSIKDEALFELKQSGVIVNSTRDLPFLQKISSQLAALAKGPPTGKTLAYRQAQRKIDNIITKDAPNYPKASKGWALKSEMERGRAEGSKFVSAKPSSVKKYLKDKPKEVKAAYKAGALESIDDVLDPAARIPDRFKKSTFDDKLSQIIPKKQVKGFKAGLDKKIEFDKTVSKIEASIESGISEAGGEAIKPRQPGSTYQYGYKAFNIGRKLADEQADIASKAILSPGMDIHNLLRGYDPYPNIPAGAIGGLTGGLIGNQ